MARKSREVRVRNDLAVRHAPHCRDDVALERRPTLVVDGDLGEQHCLAFEVSTEPVDESFDFRGRAVTATRAFRGYRRPRGRWVDYPALGGGFSCAPARTRACT